MRRISFFLIVALGLTSPLWAETHLPRPAADGTAPAQHAAFLHGAPHPPEIVTVPAETEAKIQLLSGIHSGVSHEGDPFTAQLVSPISIDGQVVLPAGSLIGGRITYIRREGRLRRAAEIGLRFELVTLPDGKDQPISALLTGLDAKPRTNTEVDAEGILKGTNAGTWKRLTGGLLGLGVFSAIQAQVASTAAMAATLPITGGAVLGLTFLVPKGNEVHVPPDSQMRIRLRQPLTLRVDW
jgi:hypothetical protein